MTQWSAAAAKQRASQERFPTCRSRWLARRRILAISRTAISSMFAHQGRFNVRRACRRARYAQQVTSRQAQARQTWRHRARRVPLGSISQQRIRFHASTALQALLRAHQEVSSVPSARQGTCRAAMPLTYALPVGSASTATRPTQSATRAGWGPTIQIKGGSRARSAQLDSNARVDFK